MKIINKLVTYFLFAALVLLHSDLLADEVEYTILSSGYVDESFPSQNLTINDRDSLNALIGQLNEAPDLSNVDFDKEVVTFIIPDNSSYPDTVSIKGIEKLDSGRINVEYIVDSIPYVQKRVPETTKPYTLLIVRTADTKNPRISFMNADPKEPVFVNQSLDDAVKYTNVMKQSSNEMFIKYFPLDKGNSWTYEYEFQINKGKQTFSIVSYTQDWSVFDSFFGKNNLAMKIDRDGNLFVSSNKGIRPFYNENIEISFPKEPFTVEAGTFEDVLIITSTPNSPLEFKDVYAKDVGLIYHEHTSPKGTAKYSLTSGKVRGRNIP